MLHGLIAIALLAAGPADAREQITPFGRVELAEIDHVPPADAMPMMHVVERRRELVLRWRIPNNLGEVSLSDDGIDLRIAAQGRDCAALAGAPGYEDRVGQPSLRRIMRERLTEWLNVCPRITKAEAQAALAAYASVENDLIAGTEALRRRAQQRFGPNLKRCWRSAKKMGGRIVAPNIFAPCERAP